MSIFNQTELKKAAMAFELKDGNVLLISNEDVNEIANKIIIKMLINNQYAVYNVIDDSIQKAKFLYDVMREANDSMSQETKQEYYLKILEIIDKGELSFEDFHSKHLESKS